MIRANLWLLIKLLYRLPSRVVEQRCTRPFHRQESRAVHATTRWAERWDFTGVEADVYLEGGTVNKIVRVTIVMYIFEPGTVQECRDRLRNQQLPVWKAEQEQEHVSAKQGPLHTYVCRTR